MAYSKAELKSNGHKVSPCLKPFVIGNMSDTFLISITSFMGIPNSMRILYNASFLTE